jgi:5-methylcytosine-specific restriction endonuclease McrA
MALTEAQKARCRRHYAAHRDAKIAKVTARLAKRAEDSVLAEIDRQINIAARARYRLRHPDRVRESSAKWTAAHPEQVNATRRARYADNPAKPLANNARRYALRKGAERCDLTDTQWETIKAQYGYCCAYCGRKMQRLTKDHITPLSAGGPDTLWNIVPACRSCNAKKGTGAVLIPVQPLLL